MAASHPSLDPETFRAAIAVLPVQAAPLRTALEEAGERIDQGFEAGVPIQALVRLRAGIVDAVLVRLWTAFELDSEGLALAAVGGYGRGELHPYSDIDITVLLDRAADAAVAERLRRFVTCLFDLRMKIGHSVRTLAECRTEAAADITVTTALMESRRLAGDVRVFDAMRAATAPDRIWPADRFFAAKRDEQAARHHKFDDTAQNLEPHVKEGPGGLRDIQTVNWVAHRHYGGESLAALVDQGFLTREEYETLRRAQLFLWRVRYALHLTTRRAEDRLLFDSQRRVAELFGYSDQGRPNHAVEQFMKSYYRTANDVSRLSEMLLELFQEAIVDAGKRARVRPLNNRFQTRNNYIEVRDPRVFKHYPWALLEVFLLLQHNPGIEGVRASTIRLIRDHRHLIDDKLRHDLRARSLFLEILRQPRRVGFELIRMHRYGVLGAYLPIIEAVTGLMQFDLFHVYTVDQHTLTVVWNLRRFWVPTGGEPALCLEVAGQIPKPELLYVAGLFHDVAKGRGGDHSELGEQESIAFCRNHQLPEWDTHLVAWLVRHHLDMSTTAQRKDISDPRVVNDFAGFVGDVTRLNYLYLLTCADILGTNPRLWTSWKDSLLRELYYGTLRALRRGLENPIGRAEHIAQTKAEARAALAGASLEPESVERLWSGLPDDYFLRHSPEEILWHAQNILACPADRLPLVLLREATGRGGTAIFIYMPDRDYLFATMTRTLDQQGLDILDARIITSRDGFTLDTYFVLEADSGEMIGDAKRAAEIVQALHKALTQAEAAPATVNRRTDRKVKAFRIPTVVSFDQDEAGHRTRMEVVTSDRPGVLARIGMALQFCGVRLQNARIATYGERVEDIFYLTTRDNEPISDPLKFECLRESICGALSAPDG
ncbi:MAG: [protein-PII] uridylyltransferase [Gammaproteobacteria bacterium]